MDKYEPSMEPAIVRINPAEDEFQDNIRRWQAAPSVEAAENGMVFVIFYGGTAPEVPGNYIKLVISYDRGETFPGDSIVIKHPDSSVRLYDPNIWIDPLNRLWIFWNQGRGFNDGRVGVWTSICESPNLSLHLSSWSSPWRIANGVMINKPLVLSNGEWLFPCAIWISEPPAEEHGLEHEYYSNVYVSSDCGKTFALRGHADIPNRSFDEHMLYEKKDGTLWMLVRTFDGIGESFSYDFGRTWTPGRKCHIDGPCSRFFIRRLSSGRLLMVNHYQFDERIDIEDIRRQGPVKSWCGRTNLTAMISEDEGDTWTNTLLLDPRNDAAYPDATERDGFIYITYDWERVSEREILLARITEDDILSNCLGDASFLAHTINKALGK